MRTLRLLPVMLGAVLIVGACGQELEQSSPSPSPPTATATPAAATPSTTATASPGVPADPSPSPAQAFDPSGLRLGLVPVADGLDAPLGITHAGDGSGRLFIVEQAGRVRIVRDGGLSGTPFLDISDRISAGGERGLLGLAFHPDYPSDGRVFVDYTDRDGDTVVSSFQTSLDADAADPESETILLRVEQPFGNHNGGALAFGPDGYLYISTGDGGGGGDPENSGRRLDTLLAKILRIDVDGQSGDAAYAIPDDNPFAGAEGARPEIFATGLRNPWRMAFDRETGDLWIGDVGQGAWEEIDVVRDGERGLDFGWNPMEGFACFPAERSDCEDPTFTMPVTAYGHEFGCAVVGGHVYRGATQERLQGGYLFADYCSGIMWAIDAASDGPLEPTIVAETGRSISAFGQDEAGESYVTDLADGVVLRIVVEDG